MSTVPRITTPVQHYAYHGERYGTAELLGGSGYLFREEGQRTASWFRTGIRISCCWAWWMWPTCRAILTWRWWRRSGGMQPEDGGGVMETYMECLYSLAHAFKVFCYHRQSWTWDEYCI